MPAKATLSSSKGQVLLGVLIILLVLLILVPVMVRFVQNEARWTAKQQQNTTAFHLAEAATERGYWRILQSTSIYNQFPLSGYNFDVPYKDISGGTYAIRITSDAARNITIVGVGRDAQRKETRAVEVKYSPNNLATNSEFTAGTNEIGGNLTVHWGPVYSRANISGTPDDWPRLYALGTIAGSCPSCAGTPPCTDALHYWCCSCAPNLPLPNLNYSKYKQLAIGYGAAPPGCHTDAGGANPSYYRSSGGKFQGCTDLSGKVYYNDGGDINFAAGSGGNRIYGSVILAVDSSINVSGNAGPGAGVCYNAQIPPNAWKEYGKDAATWSKYRTATPPATNFGFDTAAPVTFPGINGSYTTGTTHSLCNVMVKGMLWDVGDTNLTGSGNTVIHGVVYVASGMTGTGSMSVYYDNTIALDTTDAVGYTRISWKDLPGQGWPAGL